MSHVFPCGTVFGRITSCIGSEQILLWPHRAGAPIRTNRAIQKTLVLQLISAPGRTARTQSRKPHEFLKRLDLFGFELVQLKSARSWRPGFGAFEDILEFPMSASKQSKRIL